MLVASSFDLWQKDDLFSAAEVVQASADIMESTYRAWTSQRRQQSTSKYLDELCRELQTSLATAKWQLEEFQRAIRMSYKTRIDEITTTRHKQFVSAINSQISHVENALKEYFDDEVKRPLRWVNLDEKERDNLAMFLSGIPRKSNSVKDFDFKDSVKGEDSTYCKDFVNSDVNRRHVVELEPTEVLGTSEVGALKITIDHDSEKESTLKVKGSILKRRFGICWINQIFRRVGGSQRHLQTSIHLHRNCTFRLMLVLMLSIFFLVPFVLYSN